MSGFSSAGGVTYATPSGGDDSARLLALVNAQATVLGGGRTFTLSTDLDLRGKSNISLSDFVFTRASGVSRIYVGGSLDGGVTLTVPAGTTSLLAGSFTVTLDTVSANPVEGDWHLYEGKIKGAWTTASSRRPNIQIMREVMKYDSGTKLVTYRTAMPVTIDEVPTIEGTAYPLTVQKVNPAANVRLTGLGLTQVQIEAQYVIDSTFDFANARYDTTNGIASTFSNVVNCSMTARSQVRSTHASGHNFVLNDVQNCNIAYRSIAVSHDDGLEQTPAKAFRANGMMHCIADIHHESSGLFDTVIFGLIGGVTRVSSSASGVYSMVNADTTGNRNDAVSFTFVRGNARMEVHASEVDATAVEFFDARDSSALVTLNKTKVLTAADTGLVSAKGFYENLSIDLASANMTGDRTNEVLVAQSTDWISDTDMTSAGLATRRAPNNLTVTLGGGFAASSGNGMVRFSGAKFTMALALSAGTHTATYTTDISSAPKVGSEVCILGGTIYYYATVATVTFGTVDANGSALITLTWSDPSAGVLTTASYTVWYCADTKSTIHNFGMRADEMALRIDPPFQNLRVSGTWATAGSGGHVIENYAKNVVFENGSTPGGNLGTIRSITGVEMRGVRVSNWNGGGGDVYLNVPDQLNLQLFNNLTNTRVSFGASKTFRIHPVLGGWSIVGALEATVDALYTGLSQTTANDSLGNGGSAYFGTWAAGDMLVKNGTDSAYHFDGTYFKRMDPTYVLA